jgi:two-component sensor histidine kinase/ligand-binding sensor domain-containing protein
MIYIFTPNTLSKNFILRAFSLIFIFHLSLSAYSQKIEFEQFSLKDGLSQSTVNDIFQDSRGFLWFGTDDGLNKYDGYQFVIYRNVPSDSLSISDNSIKSITEDNEGNIWIATNLGLNKFDQKSNQFIHFFYKYQNPFSISGNKINAVYFDKFDNLWVGTENGLNFLAKGSNKFIEYKLKANNEQSISNNYINCIYGDSKGEIWIGTKIGLNKYNYESNTFTRYKTKFDNLNTVNNDNIKSVWRDFYGILWIGTANGLNRFDIDKNKFSVFLNNPNDSTTIIGNNINDICEDNDRNLWIATENGISIYNSQTNNFKSYTETYDRANKENLPVSRVLSFCQDKSGLLWLGTYGGGICKVIKIQSFFNELKMNNAAKGEKNFNILSIFNVTDDSLLIGTTEGILALNKNKKIVTDFTTVSKSPFETVSSPVKAIINDFENNIWLATVGFGIYKYDILEKTGYNYFENDTTINSLKSNNVNQILFDGKNKLWIATQESGLFSYDREKNLFKNFRYQVGKRGGLKDNTITCLAFQDENQLWIGTSTGGLYLMNTETEQLTTFLYNKKDEQSISSNTILSLFVSKNNIVWIGTKGGGINKLLENEKKFKRYSVTNGLSNDVICGIIGDNADNIWISTNNGLSLFNPTTEIFRNYGEADGLLNNTYNVGSLNKSKDGNFYFGGINGIDFFNPDSLKLNKYLPPVYITSIQLLDKTQNELFYAEYQQNLYNGEPIIIDYFNSSFKIDFAALSFHQSEKNQFAYKLEKLFNDWTFVGNNRSVTYTSLEPGTYLFKVIASNNDGQWNYNGDEIKIIIKPAFWQTTWFLLAMITLISTIIAVVFRIRVKNFRKQKIFLEKTVKERTREIEKERDTKELLLREIHHRVKNNLQIISSLLSLQSRYIQDQKSIALFDESQNRIRSMSLIHEKMYQSKDLSSVNIEEYIKDLTGSLIRTYQLSQNIKLDLKINVDTFESDTLTPLGLMINEVISNSLKYAFEENTTGTIIIYINRLEPHKFEMLLGDDGVGIPDEKFASGNTFGTELILTLTEQLDGTIERIKEMKGTMYKVIFYDIKND